jgi:hypothetical protein
MVIREREDFVKCFRKTFFFAGTAPEWNQLKKTCIRRIAANDPWQWNPASDFWKGGMCPMRQKTVSVYCPVKKKVALLLLPNQASWEHHRLCVSTVCALIPWVSATRRVGMMATEAMDAPAAAMNPILLAHVPEFFVPRGKENCVMDLHDVWTDGLSELSGLHVRHGSSC